MPIEDIQRYALPCGYDLKPHQKGQLISLELVGKDGEKNTFLGRLRWGMGFPGGYEECLSGKDNHGRAVVVNLVVYVDQPSWSYASMKAKPVYC